MLNAFLLRLRAGETDFEDSIALINALYDYTPTAFDNGLGEGAVHNAAGKNEGSCRMFAFAALNKLNEADTLALFGRFYREDVLRHPDGTDHGNIRNFIRHGWAGVHMHGQALHAKPTPTKDESHE